MKALLLLIVISLSVLVGCGGGSSLPTDAKAALDSTFGVTPYQIEGAQQGRANELKNVNPSLYPQIEELWCVLTDHDIFDMVYVWRIGLRWQVSYPYGGVGVGGVGGFRANGCTIG